MLIKDSVFWAVMPRGLVQHAGVNLTEECSPFSESAKLMRFTFTETVRTDGIQGVLAAILLRIVCLPL